MVSFNLSEIERHRGVFPVLSNICVAGTFYVAMTFAFAATGYATIQDSQELVVLRGDYKLRRWYTLSKALLATSFVHVATMVGAATWRGISSDKEFLVPFKRLSSLVMPTACVSMMPLLLAGISRPSRALDHEESPLSDNSATVQLPTGKAAQPETKLWNINSALIYSSSRVRRLDLRILLMGICVTVFDPIYAVWHHEYALVAPSLPIASIVFAFTTGNVLYFMNFIPSSRCIEPGILAAAAVAVVGVCSHQNLWNLFAVYGDKSGEHDDHNGSRLPVKIAIWYDLLLSILMVDSDRVHCEASEGPPPTTRQRQTYYLLNIPFRIRKIGFMWQLRQGTLVLVLGLAYISSLCGNDWPLPMSTTAVKLLVFVVIMSVHFRSSKAKDQHEPSRGHQIALVISIVATATAVVFSRNHIITYASDWATGACTAFFSYLVFSAAVRFSPDMTERYR